MEATAQTPSCCGAAFKERSNPRVWFGDEVLRLVRHSHAFPARRPQQARPSQAAPWLRPSHQPLQQQRLEAVIGEIPDD
jgi:hypothetical protein